MNRLLPYLKYWKPAAIGSLVLCVFASSYGMQRALIERGRAEAETAHLKQALKTLAKSSDSLIKAEKQADTLIKVRVQTLVKTKVEYRNRVDSIRVLPAPPESPKGYALVDTVAMHKAFAAHDVEEAASDSVISAQSLQIGILRQSVGNLNLMVANLNAQNRIAVSAAKPGFLAKAGNLAIKGLALYGGVSAVRDALRH